MSETAIPTLERPATAGELGAVLRSADESGHAVRIRGGGTKLGWGAPADPPAVELSTAGLAQLREHNAGDLTAIVGAGLPLAEAQRAFAGAGQMLALDPPFGADDTATIGGVVATGDSGPLRHRYGAARDLVIGMAVALPDGTIARSGGKVIKNVAGYDLAKLFAGSFGTLGAIVELSLRLHPRPPERRTLIASGEPGDVAEAATALAHASLELESLDVRLDDGGASVLARFAGAATASAAEPAVAVVDGLELSVEIVEDDDALWAAQRGGQRSQNGTVVRVSGVQTQLGEVLDTAQALSGRVVGRAGTAISWVALEDRSAAEQAEGVESLRERLSPSPCAVLDGPAAVHALAGTWPSPEPGALALMGRVKERFDPRGTLAPGTFVGGV